MNGIPGVFWALLFPPAWGYFWAPFLRRHGIPSWSEPVQWLCSALGIEITALAGHSAASEIAAAVSALIALAVWWWRRRKNRLRALRQFGAKSRARLEALVRSMPRPVPRLAPQGVPA